MGGRLEVLAMFDKEPELSFHKPEECSPAGGETQ